MRVEWPFFFRPSRDSFSVGISYPPKTTFYFRAHRARDSEISYFRFEMEDDEGLIKIMSKIKKSQGRIPLVLCAFP